jgi:hypothetical protein
MGRLTIRDDVVWARHIEGEPEITRRILAMPANAPIDLVVDGRPVRFLKMRDGRDGRPTPGLRPDPAFKQFWDSMQARRGEVVDVRLEGIVPLVDPYLASISTLLTEWDSPEDAEAFDGL